MGFILLDVPFVSQNNIGSRSNMPRDAWRSEQNGCWYASACMVGYFWEDGPRQGVPAQYAENPLDPKGMGSRYDELKRNEDFKGVPLPASQKWTAEKLYNVLEYYGPCYVRRGFRNPVTGKLEHGHAIVLIGADVMGDRVMCLDPWQTENQPGKGRQTYKIAEFNDFFKWDEYWAPGISLMYKKRKDPIAAAKYIASRKLTWWR
ncbi:MAG TPA: papain-like cysteine protease family protein [Acidiphilium sp.]